MSAGATIIPKVSIIATSEAMCSFLEELFKFRGYDVVLREVCYSGNGCISYLNGLCDVWRYCLDDKKIVVGFDSLKPEESVDILEGFLYRDVEVEYIAFTPGFDYIFDEDKELMKRYILDPEHRVPTGNCKRGQIRFINTKNNNTDGDK